MHVARAMQGKLYAAGPDVIQPGHQAAGRQALADAAQVDLSGGRAGAVAFFLDARGQE